MQKQNRQLPIKEFQLLSIGLEEDADSPDCTSQASPRNQRQTDEESQRVAKPE